MAEITDERFPFRINGVFKPACWGCPAMDIDTELQQLMIEGGTEAASRVLTLKCFNAAVCAAIENRPRKEMPFRVGDNVWFVNGQTGTIRELVFGSSDMEPVLRCLKYLDGVPYEAEYSVSEIGSAIFLNAGALNDYIKSNKGAKGDEKHADGSQ